MNEIHSICRVSSSSETLRYIHGKSETFGGNFSTQKRFSYFNHSNNDVEVPCGFFRDFPISNSGEISSIVLTKKKKIFVNRAESPVLLITKCKTPSKQEKNRIITVYNHFLVFILDIFHSSMYLKFLKIVISSQTSLIYYYFLFIAIKKILTTISICI